MPLPISIITGPVHLVTLTSAMIPLCPLVIQVEAGGEYAGIQWTRTPIALTVSNGELVDFQQTFVRTVTSQEDWGLYTVSIIFSNSSTLSLNLTPNGSANCSATLSGQSLSSDISTSMFHCLFCNIGISCLPALIMHSFLSCNVCFQRFRMYFSVTNFILAIFQSGLI